MLAVTVSSTAVDEGTLALTETQQHNLHVKTGVKVEITRFIPPSEQFTLVDVDFEVSILGSSFDNTDQDPELQTIEIDASWIGKQILNAYLTGATKGIYPY